jgi:hypothetical protein
MELREAMAQIAEIRQQMARGQIFRGYRAATTAFSGLLALATAAAQSLFLRDPAREPAAFVQLWVLAAVVSVVVVAMEMIVRVRRSASVVQKQLTLLAVEQFVPSIAAGGLLTYGVCAHAPAQTWMLPGLWMLVFALGMFASSRLLPRAIFAVAGFYLLAGIATFTLSAPQGDTPAPLAYSPWLMGAVFGVGQLATAAILFWKLERRHD